MSTSKPGFLVLLAGVATVLLALIVAPFAGALFAAAVLAGVLQPAQQRLQDGLGERPKLAAGLLTLGVAAMAIAPLAILCVYAARVLTDLYRDVRSKLESGGVDGLVDSLPETLRPFGRSLVEMLPEGIIRPGAAPSTSETLLTGTELETAAGLATDTFDVLVNLLVDLGVLVIALFFLLSQGQRLVDWILETLPLSREQSGQLVEELRDVSRAVFVATIATAFLQTVIASAGYLIAGVPFLPAALLVTFVASLVPVIGAAVIVVAIGLLLVAYGEFGYGVFLIAWGVVPVGLSDNVVKPWLAQGEIELPGSVVLFAMVGGIAVFGPMGVIAGPLIVALFSATLRLLRDERLSQA